MIIKLNATRDSIAATNPNDYSPQGRRRHRWRYRLKPLAAAPMTFPRRPMDFGDDGELWCPLRGGARRQWRRTVAKSKRLKRVQTVRWRTPRPFSEREYICRREAAYAQTEWASRVTVRRTRDSYPDTHSTKYQMQYTRETTRSKSSWREPRDRIWVYANP